MDEKKVKETRPMDEKRAKAAEARRKYDMENMAMLATKMKKDEVQAFRDLAAEEGISVSQKLSEYVRKELASAALRRDPILADKAPLRNTVPAVLTGRNADRLKHETAFHNPKGLNPDLLMNDILNRYFKWLDEARA